MMKTNKKKGFTLVELLAVIVILAIILVIAVPKVMNVIEDSKKATLESSVKMIASSAEKVKVQNSLLGKNDEITCDSVAKINNLDYASCDIEFVDNTAKVTIEGSGKFNGLSVCEGTRSNATAIEGSCSELNNKENIVPELNCIFDGELVQGVEFVHNQYTYRYKQEYYSDTFEFDAYGEIRDYWYNIEQDGWGVTLTDKVSTEQVDTPICTTINGKPVVSTAYMFTCSAATSIDLSSSNTSNITNMSSMFEYSAATNLDLNNFNTGNVTDMSSMFMRSAATSLDLSSFDTSNVTNMKKMFYDSPATSIDLNNFDTSNVTDMSSMFMRSAATSLDLSSFDTSNVTNMGYMFSGSLATTGYARSRIDAERFNLETNKPLTLTFIVKNNEELENEAPVLDCTFDGDLVQGAEFVHNTYTYRYKQDYYVDISQYDDYGILDAYWTNMEQDGWGVTITEGASVSPVLKPICTYINGKPVVSTSFMFVESNESAIYANLWNTSTITDMSYMFFGSSIKKISGLDTSNVTNMSSMFEYSAATNLDLSSFDTSNVTNMSYMFNGSAATTGYARTQADADKFNASSYKPSGLTFVVKSNS